MPQYSNGITSILYIQAETLSASASAYGQLGEGQQAQNILEQALAVTVTIVDPYQPSLKENALVAVAAAVGQLQESERIDNILEQVWVVADSFDQFGQFQTLYKVVDVASQLPECEHAQGILEHALAITVNEIWRHRQFALAAIAEAASQLTEMERVYNILEQAIPITATIKESWDRSIALVVIAKAVDQLACSAADQNGSIYLSGN